MKYNKDDRFLLYKSGSHVADIIFNNNEIVGRIKDLKDNQWSNYETIDLKNNSYDPFLFQVWDRLKELNNVNFQNYNEIKQKCVKCYKKYINIADTCIWAFQGEGLPIDILIHENTIKGLIVTTGERCNVYVKEGFEKYTPLKEWMNTELSQDKYGVNQIGTFYVKTRDGANLATEVWLPNGLIQGMKVPAILIRTPYNRLSNCDRWFKFVRRGYALVIQDVRGREDSDGEWVPYKYDIEDGDDTLNWIAAQKWCYGNIGMIGGSYLGYVQWAAAASGNPHLKAVVSMVTSGPPFIDIKRKGGIYPSGALAWAFMMAEQRMNRAALKRDDWAEIEKIRPIKAIPQKVLGKSIHFWDEYMKHPDNDEFWKKTDWTIHSSKVNVPSIIISGWYDDNGMGSTLAWEMNEKEKRENQKLIFGPWKHGFNSTREIHNVCFGDNAIRYDLDVICLKWLDKFLKNISNDIEKMPPVQYYMVGDNEWINSEKWPPENAEYKNIYLHSFGNARTSNGDGWVNMISPYEEQEDNYTFDPKNPAPFLIDVSENEMNVPENYKEVNKREDILVYTSEILKEDVSIAGNIYAEIYASSTGKDTDWLVRLEDVDSEENSIRLVDGIIRARYRNSFEKSELLEPNKIEKYEIRMAKIANVFKKGHRIRVTITSGAKNLAFPNHNTGNNPCEDIEMITVEQRIYHDKKYPSHVKLPIIKGTI